MNLHCSISSYRHIQYYYQKSSSSLMSHTLGEKQFPALTHSPGKVAMEFHAIKKTRNNSEWIKNSVVIQLISLC